MRLLLAQCLRRKQRWAVLVDTRIGCRGRAALGIKINAVNPGAFSSMIDAQQQESSPMHRYAKEHLPAELVSPARWSEVMGGACDSLIGLGIHDPAADWHVKPYKSRS
jgi:hypothetical protein